jgi:ATP-dependent Clp protease ATP-binding subunit ClpC
MFERLTDRARQSIALAQEAAVGLGHTYIGCEHLLLGLVLEGTGVAAVVLKRHGIDANTVRAAIVETVGESTSTVSDGDALASLGIDLSEVRRRLTESFGPNALPSPDRPPFTPRARDALERTVRESEAHHHGYVGTEHVLLALLHEDGNFARKILTDHDIDLAVLRAEIVELAAPDFLRIKAADAKLVKLQFLVIDAQRFDDTEAAFKDVTAARVKEVTARTAATKTFADEYEAAVAKAEAVLKTKGLVLEG